MPTFECSSCGRSPIERSYDVMAVEIMCPECGEFCPHVNLDNHRVHRIVENNDVERSAKALVAAFRGRL